MTCLGFFGAKDPDVNQILGQIVAELDDWKKIMDGRYALVRDAITIVRDPEMQAELRRWAAAQPDPNPVPCPHCCGTQ